jgi:SSS family solute:Na+ symporter
MLPTILTFLFFTALVAVLTWLMTRRDDTQSSDGIFLGGRSLTYPFIAGSLLLTNLSTEQLVGLNGSAFLYGLHVMIWEVLAVVALVIMGLFFLPKFLRSGIATVPQYVEVRYDKKTRTIVDSVFLIAYALLLLPLILYSGARGLVSMLDIGALTGIESERNVLIMIVIVIGVIGSVYALCGGLKAVAVSGTLYGVGLLVGGFMITYYGLQEVSEGKGMLEGVNQLRSAAPERFNSIGGPDDEVPFTTVFTGVILLHLFYWCTNQQIIQRTFGASSLGEGQKGVLLTAALKLIGPLYLIIPGMLAYHLYADQGVAADDAYGTLVRGVLPPALTGFFAAAMVGAILSSFNSALNSTCTLFGLGFYKTFIKHDASDQEVVVSGRWFGIGIAIVAMAIAPLLLGQDSLFTYLQTMNAIYFVPLFAIVLVGMLTKRVPPLAAKVAMGVGFVLFLFGYYFPVGSQLDANGASKAMNIAGDYINTYHYMGVVFVAMLLVMWAIRLWRPREEDFVQVDVKAVDMTPWRHRKLVSCLLIVSVLCIYAYFADFSVWFSS